MSQEPQARNEISGQTTGNTVRAGQIHGNVTNSLQNIHNVNQDAVAPPRLNPWLVYAGVLALLAAIGLVGVARTTTNTRERVGLFFALWLLWTALDLWTRKRQALISQGFSRYDDPLVLKWLPVLGVIAMVVLSGHVKDKA